MSVSSSPHFNLVCPILAKFSTVLWGRFKGMQNTPKTEVLHSPGAGICTSAKGRSRDRSNEMRTFSTTAELATCPGLALCVCRAAWLPEEGNCKKREEIIQKNKNGYLLYNCQILLNVIFALNAPWAKDTAILEEKLPSEEPKGQKHLCTFCQRRQGDFNIAYPQSHAGDRNIETGLKLTWLNKRLDFYLQSDFWACSKTHLCYNS